MTRPPVKPPTLDEMISEAGEPEPGHDEWVRRQVQRMLDKKRAGELKYRDFDEVAAEFGFKR